jgi:hypothetical protein
MFASHLQRMHFPPFVIPAVAKHWAHLGDENGELEDEEYAAYIAECDAGAERAGLEAAALWDEWHARACTAVDALQASGSSPGTVSNVSTSPSGTEPLTPAPAASRTG